MVRGKVPGEGSAGCVRETGAKMGENPHSELGSLSPTHIHTFSLFSLSLAGMQLVDLTNSPIDLYPVSIPVCHDERREGVRLLRKWMRFATRS